jgi:tetratricopeptide (TPR) repeat protein
VALFVEELTKAVLESRSAFASEDDRESGDDRHVVVPATLQDSLMARLDRLGTAKIVAQTGAALGREFPHKLLAACAPLDEDELGDALDRLVDAELLFFRRSPHETLYSFKHALVRDTAYGSLLRSRRRDLHKRIAQAIETGFQSMAENQPELLAHHLTEAGLSASAVIWWSRAGQRELHRSANSEAANHLQRALELLQTLPAGRERDRWELDLRVQIKAPLQVTKGFASTAFEDNTARALSIYDSLGKMPSMLPFLWGECVTSIVRCEQALDKARNFLRRAEREGDADAILTAHRGLGHSYLAAGDIRAASRHLEQALKLYDRTRREALIANYSLDPLPSILGQHALVMQQLGRHAEAAALVADGRRHASQAGHFGSSAYATFYIGLFHMIDRDVEALGEVATEALLLSQRHGGNYWSVHLEVLLGWRQAVGGATDVGLERMRRAEAERERIGARIWKPLYLAEEARILIECGRSSEALGLLETGLSIGAAMDHRFAEAELHRVRALAFAAEGLPRPKIAACLDLAVQFARSRGSLLWEQRALATRAELIERGTL